MSIPLSKARDDDRADPSVIADLLLQVTADAVEISELRDALANMQRLAAALVWQAGGRVEVTDRTLLEMPAEPLLTTFYGVASFSTVVEVRDGRSSDA